MEKFTNFTFLLLAFVATSPIIIRPVYAQSRAICSGAMIQSFGSCIKFLTGGSNASSPTPDCCTSLKNLVSNGQDCLCLIVTGGVPFQMPINPTLAISLPRACRMSRVPLECKANVSPVPAHEKPSGSEPNLSPASPPPSPRVPTIPQAITPSLAPESDLVPTLTPPGMRPSLIPSAAESAHNMFWSLMAAALGAYFSKPY